MFKQRVHTPAKKRSIPNTITIHSKFSFLPFLLFHQLFDPLFFGLSSMINYTISNPFFIFILLLIFFFCFFFSFFFFLFCRLSSLLFSCPFPHYFACNFCFLNSLMIFLINIRINNKHNIMGLWILHPSLILNNQIFLLLNYWCNLIKNKNYSYYNLYQRMV